MSVLFFVLMHLVVPVCSGYYSNDVIAVGAFSCINWLAVALSYKNAVILIG